MKYEFIRVDDDTTLLKYKDKEITIKRDIELQVKIQSSVKRARIMMNKDLSSMGMTKKDLVIERHEGNKTYYDNANIMDVEEQYQTLAIQEVFEEIVKKYSGMTLEQLMLDIGLNAQTENEENKKFGEDLAKATMGKTEKSPSEE